MVRTAQRFALAATCLITGTLVLCADAPRAQTPAQNPQQPAPVFKANTSFVQVDAYPTKDGKIVEGLTAKDFQLFEDGKPQTIDAFEFIRIEPNTPEAMRRDPNTQAEGDRLAADPRNRVFVLYLDHYHASLYGSHSVKGPIVTMLNRLLTPTDLFGVATALMRPRDLVLGRQTTTIEDQLEKNWTWGLQSGAVSLDEKEEGLVRCYGEPVALQIVARTREARTFESLSGMVQHLGAIREARKAFVVLSHGWELYEPDQDALMKLQSPEKAGLPRIGIGPGGQISTRQPNSPGFADWSWCASELSRAYTLDNRKAYRALIDLANRNNVSFYPINVDGLASGGHAETLRSLAENTDGIISNTNDVNLALRRVADDVSAYYLLGYSSTNAKQDGTYRRIDVKMAAPGLRIKARRGYVAPAENTRPGPVAPAKPAIPPAIADALGALSRLRVSAELFGYGVANTADLSVVVELPSGAVSSAPWNKGADVQASLAGTQDNVTPVTARIEPGMRSALLTIPRPGGAGPYRINVKVSAGGSVINDRIEIADVKPAVLGEPLIYRAAPAPVAPLRPAADSQFWHTERIHVEWPVAGPLDRREGRLLGKDGRALALPVNLTERSPNGKAVLAADVNLAPLAPGDYVIEVVAGIGGDEARRYIPIRVVR